MKKNRRKENNGSAAGNGSVRAAVAHDEVARRAYELWQQDGSPMGRDMDYWFDAEAQLRGNPHLVAPAESAIETRLRS